MEDTCVFCGSDVSDLGVHICDHCLSRAGIIHCGICDYFIGSEYSNVGYCSMKCINTSKTRFCEKGCHTEEEESTNG